MHMRLAASVALVAAVLGQVPFEQAIQDLSNADATVRFRAAQMLKEAAYPEAAVPLAKAVTDPQDEVQLEAIAGELNIFLAEKIVPRKRVGFVIEKRSPVVAETVFSSGPLAIGSRPVPPDVLTGLRAAARDDNPRVALEALYAFGVLAVEPGGAARRELLRATGPEVAALTGSADPAVRYAAVRVLGRVLAKRPQDDPIESTVGDAVITALNDRDRAVKGAAMDALGSMRYERGLEALTQLFQYYGKGEGAEASLDAIARIAHPSSSPLLVAALTSKSTALRVIAIEGLARLRDPAASNAIQAVVLSDRSDAAALAGTFASAMLSNAPFDRIVEALSRSRLRDQAKQYLFELAPGRSAAFTKHLQDPDATIRADAIDAIGLGGDAAAIPIVEPMQQDRDPQVVRAADRALARLRQAGS
jgi:HEAT repeat protein